MFFQCSLQLVNQFTISHLLSIVCAFTDITSQLSRLFLGSSAPRLILFGCFLHCSADSSHFSARRRSRHCECATLAIPRPVVTLITLVPNYHTPRCQNRYTPLLPARQTFPAEEGRPGRCGRHTSAMWNRRRETTGRHVI